MMKSYRMKMNNKSKIIYLIIKIQKVICSQINIKKNIAIIKIMKLL